MENNKHIVISLGGSLIVPDSIDVAFIKEFIETIKEYTKKSFKFAIVTGGGHTARNYIEASKNITTPSHDDLDWLGIATTRVNSELVRIGFGDVAYESIVMNPDIMPNTDKPIIVGGGWKPGNSSDLAAVHCARSLGAKVVINLSNIDYAYDKDPKKFPDAKRLESVSWAEYRSYIPTEWSAGLNTPFDPVASKKAEEIGIEVAILNGKNIENLKNYLDGVEFVGTVIK